MKDTKSSELLERKKKFGSLGAIDFLLKKQESANVSYGSYPVNYEVFNCKPIPVEKNLDRWMTKPSNFPKDLVLPPLVGLGNDYTELEKLRDPHPHKNQKKVSIVILNYNRTLPLERTLCGIANQTYPLNLIEVIVADDGSKEDTLSAIKKYEKLLNIKYVWHKDVGFTAATARNNGVRVARSETIILLDVDMYPSSDLVMNYMKWWKTLDKAVLVGPRKYIDINNLDPEEILSNKEIENTFATIKTNNVVAGKIEGEISVDWRLEIFKNTQNLKTEKVPYRIFASGNVAFSKEMFESVGGFDERFVSWGYEDTELGFRFWNRGLYIVPVLDAWAFHQEPVGGENETDREAGKQKSARLFGTLSPHYRQLAIKKENFEVPTVSIYIPAYNCQDTICDAVDSALQQTYKDLEVCICNDGSTDNTLDIIEKYFSKNPRVRWVSQTNGGIGKASNTAVKLCRGIYIGQLDSDDYLARDVVEKCVQEFINKPNIGLVYTSYENEYSSGEIKQGYNYPVFTREKMLSAMIAHHFRFFKKAYWWRTGGFNERIRNAVDYDMYLKLSEVCEAKHLNIVGYRRRLHGENTSIVGFSEQMKNTAVVVNQALNRAGAGFQVVLEKEDSPGLIFNLK